MIRNDAEYREAVERLAAERSRLAEHRARLKATGLSDDEVKRVTDPMELFHLQFSEEVESYERLKRGEFDDLENLPGPGAIADLSSDCPRSFAARASKAARRARVAGIPG